MRQINHAIQDTIFDHGHTQQVVGECGGGRVERGTGDLQLRFHSPSLISISPEIPRLELPVEIIKYVNIPRDTGLFFFFGIGDHLQEI